MYDANHKWTDAYPGKGWPTEGTVSELKVFAKKKLGDLYHDVVVRTYGGGTQAEVLRIKHGYHGREIIREKVYR